MTVPDADGAFTGISDITYHADSESLSSSGARDLMRSPFKFNWAQSQPRVEKRHYDVGHYVHARILGVGQEVEVIDAENYKTKAAQEDRDAAYGAGKIPLLVAEKADADLMADAVLGHRHAAQLLDGGTPEVSMWWHDLSTGERLRSRPDKLVEYDDIPPLLIDVKTTGTSARPVDFGSTAAKYGYYFQDAWYREAVRAIGIHEDSRFVFINVEKDPPHLVSVTQLPTRAVDIGRQEMRRAIDLWHECRVEDFWPDWPDHDPDEIATSDLPAWFYRTH